MATKPYRQNLSGAQGTTLTGAHGGTQQLGAAAQRRLPQQGGPTPPIMDPAQKPDVPAWQQLRGVGLPGQGSAAANRALVQSFQNPQSDPGFSAKPAVLPGFSGSPGGPNVFHPTNPGVGPGIASMDGIQNGAAGPAGMFGHAGQQLGVQAPGDAGNIDNAISSLRSQLGISQPQPDGAGSVGYGGNNNPMSGEMAANLGQFTGTAKPWTGGFSFNGSPGPGVGTNGMVLNAGPGQSQVLPGGPSARPLPTFGASPGAVPVGVGPGTSPNFAKPMPANGAGGIAQQPNPYASLLRSRLGAGSGGNTGVGGASLRGY